MAVVPETEGLAVVARVADPTLGRPAIDVRFAGSAAAAEGRGLAVAVGGLVAVGEVRDVAEVGDVAFEAEATRLVTGGFAPEGATDARRAAGVG